MNASEMILGELQAAADRAAAAEAAFGREAARRRELLEKERSAAFRRLDVLTGLMTAVATTDKEDEAVSRGQALLREELGWDTDSELRREVLERFATIVKAAFTAGGSEGQSAVDELRSCLFDFETWYAEARGTSFWTLFDQYMPQTPVVDF